MTELRPVLAADADRALNDLLVRILARDGLPVRHLLDPADVTPEAAADCALVVLGSGRRGVAGADAAAALRRAGVSTPVLILVASSDPVAAAIAASDPGVRILKKPFSPTEMATVVRDLLDA